MIKQRPKGLLQMNYKKGFIRIFLIGLLISPTIGFFSTAEEIKKIEFDTWDDIHEISKEIKHVLCADFVKDNPKEFPRLISTNACYWTYVYWDTIRKWQEKNGKAGEIIDEETVKQAMIAKADSAKSEFRWTQAGNYIKSYLLLCIALLVIFFISKWIYKGFKSH